MRAERLGKFTSTRISLCLLMFLALPVSQSFGANVHTSSCKLSELKTTIERVESGATIDILPGVCDWQDDTLVITKSLKLRGNGQTWFKRTKLSKTSLVEVRCDASSRFELEGLGFIGLADRRSLDRGVALTKGCQNFKIHGNTFRGFGNAALEISNFSGSRHQQPTGVIYNNQFEDNFRIGSGYGVAVYFDGRLRPRPEFGQAAAVFIEDNVFHGNRHAIASNHSAVYVFRNNEIVDNHRTYSAIDTHGQTKKDKAGTLQVEIYRNRLTQTPGNTGFAGIGLRGGAALVFENDFVNYRSSILLTVEDSGKCRSWSVKRPDQPGPVYIWGNSDNYVTLNQPADCRHLFEKNVDYIMRQPKDYQPYHYPHPLREAR